MKKKVLVFSILCLLFITINYTYSSFQNTIVGNISATSNNWRFAVNVTNGIKENDYFKVPIGGTSGSFSVTLNTTNSSNNVKYSIELSGYNLPSDIKYYKDSSYSTLISNNLYSDTINKNTSKTITIYYKSSSTISGYVYVKVKGNVKEGTSIYEYISKLTNNGIDSSLDFSAKSSSTNGDGINIVSGTQTNTYPIYYYRGNITNNNIIYAGFCWKIVRTTETGGVKLIYNGNPINGKCNNTGTSSQLSTTIQFNNYYSSPIHVGYMYGLTAYSAAEGTAYKTHLSDSSLVPTTNTTTEIIGNKSFAIAGRHNQNAQSSTIKKAVDAWYQNNIEGTSYEGLLEDTIWCADRTTSTSNETLDDMINGTNDYFYFDRYKKINSTPPSLSLSCSREVDRFTVSTSNGNGDLEYPIGLITVDEARYAGAGKSNNDVSSYLTTGSPYHTMTPMWYYTGAFYVYGVSALGAPTTEYPANSHGVRPAVSLSNSVLYKSGDGTSDNPYTVE